MREQGQCIINSNTANHFLYYAVGWGTDQGIGGFGEEPGIKSQLMNLIRSVRTVMRGKKKH